MPKLKPTKDELRIRTLRSIIVGRMAYYGYTPDEMALALRISRSGFFRKKSNPMLFTQEELWALWDKLHIKPVDYYADVS